jgi:hypothetical protein
MKWRAILGVTVGLMLPLAFIFDHCGAWLKEYQTQIMTPQDTKSVPILEPDQRRALLTYGRSCESQKDCDPPLACLRFSPTGESVCIDSSCRTDLQCKQGFTCRTRKAPGDGALVRRCILIGNRKEGQPCFDSTRDLEEACERELLCGSGYCGRPCQLDVPSSCPAGFVCRGGPDAPSCRPFCKGGDCPAGQECVGVGTDEASCMIVHGENCQRHPCSQGQQCNISYSPGSEAWTAEMECLTPCDEKHPCSEDSVCFMDGCRRRCGPGQEDVCGPRQRCAQYPFDHLWICKPAAD